MFGARARARSTDFDTPWPEAPAFGRSLAYPVGAIAVIAYASLLPFSLNFHALDLSHPLAALTFRAGPLEDLLVNLLLYVPIGCLFSLGARRWCGRSVVRAVVGIAAAFGLSLVIEVLQTAVVGRVPSWIDVFTNTIGAGLGACLGTWWGQTQRSQALSEWASDHVRDVRAWSSVLTAGLLLYGLAPFDFVTSTTALHDSFRHARWDLLQPRPIGLTDAPFALLSHELMGAAWFALLGVLYVLRSVERRGRAVAFVSAVQHGVLLAATIEMLQLFTPSHGCDVASLVLRSIAAALGAWLAVQVVVPLRARFRDGAPCDGPVNLGLFVLLMIQSVLLFMEVKGIGPVSVDRLLEGRVGVWPLERLWHTPALDALTALTSMVCVAAPLALVIALLARRCAPAIARTLAVCGTVVIVLVCETIRAATGDGVMDLTASVVAGGVAYVLAGGLRWALNVGTPLTRRSEAHRISAVTAMTARETTASRSWGV